MLYNTCHRYYTILVTYSPILVTAKFESHGDLWRQATVISYRAGDRGDHKFAPGTKLLCLKTQAHKSNDLELWQIMVNFLSQYFLSWQSLLSMWQKLYPPSMCIVFRGTSTVSPAASHVLNSSKRLTKKERPKSHELRREWPVFAILLYRSTQSSSLEHELLWAMTCVCREQWQARKDKRAPNPTQ